MTSERNNCISTLFSGNRKLEVYDDILPVADLRSIHNALLQACYSKTEYARLETFDFRHWATEISIDVAETMTIFGPTMLALDSFNVGSCYNLHRAYVNVANYGDMLYSHLDCEPGAGEITALWYISEKWNHEWGGETVFFDDSKDIRAAVLPRPGRLALFNGDILHAGRPPNRICFSPRYTLALKFEPIRTSMQ